MDHCCMQKLILKKIGTPMFGTPIPIFLGLRAAHLTSSRKIGCKRTTMTAIEAFPYLDVGQTTDVLIYLSCTVGH